jgi:hypothetical protein
MDSLQITLCNTQVGDLTKIPLKHWQKEMGTKQQKNKYHHLEQQ